MQERNESFTRTFACSIRDRIDQHLYTGFDFSSNDRNYLIKVSNHLYGYATDDNLRLFMQNPIVWNLEVITDVPIVLNYSGLPISFISQFSTDEDDTALVNSIYDTEIKKYRTSFDGIALFLPRYNPIGFSGYNLTYIEMQGRIIDVPDVDDVMWYTNGKIVYMLNHSNGCVGIPYFKENPCILDYMDPNVIRDMIDIYISGKYTVKGRDEIFSQRYHAYFISLFLEEIKGLSFLQIKQIYSSLRTTYPRSPQLTIPCIKLK